MKYRCTCYASDEQMRGEGHPELACSASAGCLREFDVGEADHPLTFCRDPICPPCYESLKETLAALKTKGVTVEVDHGDNA